MDNRLKAHRVSMGKESLMLIDDQRGGGGLRKLRPCFMKGSTILLEWEKGMAFSIYLEIHGSTLYPSFVFIVEVRFKLCLVALIHEPSTGVCCFFVRRSKAKPLGYGHLNEALISRLNLWTHPR